MLGSVFPDALKSANIVTVYKRAAKDIMNNYKSVSILLSFFKIFEKMLHINACMIFLLTDMFSGLQFGFLPEESCEKASFNCLHDILSSIDKKIKVCGSYLDFSKVLDTIDYQVIYNKLEKYGVRGISLSVIKSYMSARRRCLCVCAAHYDFKLYIFIYLVGIPLSTIA